MTVIARNVTHDVCSHCGETAGMGAHGHSDAPDWRWLRVEYVPADQLREAENDVVDLVNELADAASRFRRKGDIFGATQAEALLKRFCFSTAMGGKSRSSNQRGA